jgi:hypothetical protein
MPGNNQREVQNPETFKGVSHVKIAGNVELFLCQCASLVNRSWSGKKERGGGGGGG